MAKITCGKTRPSSRPYEVWVAGGWTWKVLKKYQADDNKPGARVFCEVTSPMTMGMADLGDVWIRDIQSVATLVSTDYDS